jgi:hypothetical protein
MVSRLSYAAAPRPGWVKPAIAGLIVLGILFCIYGVINEAIKGLPADVTIYTTAHGPHSVHRWHVVVSVLCGVICFTTAWYLDKKHNRGLIAVAQTDPVEQLS